MSALRSITPPRRRSSGTAVQAEHAGPLLVRAERHPQAAASVVLDRLELHHRTGAELAERFPQADDATPAQPREPPSVAVPGPQATIGRIPGERRHVPVRGAGERVADDVSGAVEVDQAPGEA